MSLAHNVAMPCIVSFRGKRPDLFWPAVGSSPGCLPRERRVRRRKFRARGRPPRLRDDAGAPRSPKYIQRQEALDAQTGCVRANLGRLSTRSSFFLKHVTINNNFGGRGTTALHKGAVEKSAACVLFDLADSFPSTFVIKNCPATKMVRGAGEADGSEKYWSTFYDAT